MSDESNNSSSSSGQNRRSSFAGDTFASIFGTRRSNSVSNKPAPSVPEGNNGSQPTQQHPGPIASAAAQAQRRRLSLTTLGLSASPNQPSSLSSYRRESAVSSTSGSIDESVVEDDLPTASPNPQTPFGRRMSFGARALRDVRGSGSASGGGGTGGGGGEQNEGFNWSDNFSTRAKRTSIAAGQGNSPPAHVRSKSAATMEPPIKEMPKPKESNRPDHFQERILKGDFYMD